MRTIITVATTFAAAHWLPEHEGKCQRLHGHTYGLEVTVEGTPQESGPAAGMVMDFAELRKQVAELVVEQAGPSVAERDVRFRPHDRSDGRVDLRATARRRSAGGEGAAGRGPQLLGGSLRPMSDPRR